MLSVKQDSALKFRDIFKQSELSSQLKPGAEKRPASARLDRWMTFLDKNHDLGDFKLNLYVLILIQLFL